MSSGLVPRRIARPNARKPTISHAQRHRLVASAPAALAASRPTTAPPSLSDLSQERQDVVGQLVDLLFDILSPLSLALRSCSEDWTQRLLASEDEEVGGGGRLHVTRLLQLYEVRRLCESSVEVGVALRRVEEVGWIQMSKDGYSFSLDPAIRSDISASNPHSFWRRLVDQDRIVYAQDLPSHLNTQQQVLFSIRHHLAASFTPDERFTVYDVYSPTRDMKPPWLSHQSPPTKRHEIDGRDRSVRFAQVLLVLSSSEAARKLAALFPWQVAGNGERRTRCLTIKEWTQKRTEFFDWRARILSSNRSSLAAQAQDDTDPSPARAGLDVLQAPPPSTIPEEDTTVAHPIGTILHLPHLTLASPLDIVASSRSIKGTLERLVPSSVGYVDLHPSALEAGQVSCHVRTPNRFIAHRLLDALRGTASPSFLKYHQDKGEITILSGEEEEAYWHAVPIKTRNAAKKKALAASATDLEPPKDAVAAEDGANQDEMNKASTKKKKKKRKAAPTAVLSRIPAKHARFD